MTGSLPADDRRPTASVAIIGNDAVLAAAPATPVQLAHACLRRGFTVAVPVTWGDELLAAEAVRRLSSRERGPAVMCVCPYVRSRLLAPGPDLAPFLVSLVPPPVATARYLRTVYGERGVHITYIGACPGADDQAIDARLTPEGFLGDLAEHGISLAEQPLVFDSIVPPDRRRWCSLPGGVPSAEVLWSDTDTRTLVEIDRDDVSTDLAQHIIARDHVLLDLAPSLGCSCSGAIPSLPPRSARVAVTALEPPRALGPVIEPTTVVQLDAPVDGPRAVPRPPVVEAPQQPEFDHDARERALDMILGGEPEMPSPEPPRSYARSLRRAEAAMPAPAARRPTDVFASERAMAPPEQPPIAPPPHPTLLETLIDDIIIEPLIIPNTKSAKAETLSMPSADPAIDRSPARLGADAVVELDVVREVVIESASNGVRYDEPAVRDLTTGSDPARADEPHGVLVVEVHQIPDVHSLVSPGDESPSSDAETMIEMAPEAAAPVDLPDSTEEAPSVEVDDSLETTSTVRRRTPPAMPARHPASTIPKAVSAGGRPLPRAYVAKRRMTPPGNTVIPAVPVAPEPAAVDAAVAAEAHAPTEPVVVDATDISPSPEPPGVDVSPAEAPVRQPEVAQGPMTEPEDDTPPTSESVWGATVETPVVLNPVAASSRDPVASARPIRLASSPVDASEPEPEPRSNTVVGPVASSNALVTILVVALVTLAGFVFVLLRR